MEEEEFAKYWFGYCGVVVLLDATDEEHKGKDALRDGRDWEKDCLGTFYIKPNYPGTFFLFFSPFSADMNSARGVDWLIHGLFGLGRCSHNCNAGFLTTPAARGRGVGSVMGEAYLEFAPKLVCSPIGLLGTCV